MTMSNDSDIQEIMEKIVRFTEDRDWDQFHNGKDLALALSIEAAELNELYLWKKPEEVNVGKVKEELADILNYAFLIADKYKLDIKEIILDKLERNALKYPVDKSRGNARKYNEL
ncbi:MAG TPA: nucleotide pyrophosphohydrolase [Mediterranea massiliensis]|uniref:Nucleotide pyrophosphohydrolase n=1 Tax=Mediterranea massiliensis TaxID=1841865 RepID=A0A921HUT5_9BACT|nr:nucleotide pyrophosphohydrolase [Mediterranea massiliensis]HJF91276.1 nucleotide pyrophosphohydrolase [Mediterranea massiliensis]